MSASYTLVDLSVYRGHATACPYNVVHFLEEGGDVGCAAAVEHLAVYVFSPALPCHVWRGFHDAHIVFVSEIPEDGVGRRTVVVISRAAGSHYCIALRF